MSSCSAGWGIYLRRAMLSGGHLIAFGGIFILAVTIPETWTALTIAACAAAVLAADAVVVLLVSLARSFRLLVDQDIAERVRLVAVARRASLLSRMSDSHQRQLRVLEALVDAVRAGPLAHAAPAQPIIDACGDLLATFVVLAIRHHRSQACLDGVDRDRLGEDITALERTIAGATEPVRSHAERRLGLARRRATLWDSARARLDAIDGQLAMIAERIHLAHEEAGAPRAWDSTAHLRVAVPDEDDLEALRVEEEVDPVFLALGRACR